MNSLAATMFSDGSWVIIGEHVSRDMAQILMNKEDPEIIVDWVQHFWVQHRYMSDEDIIDNDIDWYGNGERPKWWVLIESAKRPKGIIKAATVIIPK